MPTSDFDQVIERLGITEEDVLENAQKYKLDAKEALAYTVMARAQTPPLPNTAQKMQQAGMKYNNTPRDIEAATSGVGGAIAGGLGGMALGPGGAVAGALGGSGMGAAMSYIMNALTNSPGEAFSANRVLDLAGPAVGGAIGKLPKLGATAKALTNTAADTLMAYMADAEDNKRSGTDGKNPLGRAMATAGMGGVLSGITRQGTRQKANVDLVDDLDQRYDTSSKPSALQDKIYSTLEYEKKPPITLFGADEKPITMRDKTPAYSEALTNSPDVQKFIRERPGDIYNYVLSPLTSAKTQFELQKAAPQFRARLGTISKLAGGKEKESLMAGLKNSFIDSVATTNEGTRIANPDSFKMRLGAMGPELVDEVMGPDAYAKLTMLSEAASKAGPLGRFSIRFGEGGNAFVAKHIVSLDEDSKMTNNALDKGKILALATSPFSGGNGLAAAGAIQAYEVYKIPIDKLLNKTDKKTLAALSSGLLNSTSNSVVNKLTEWFEKNADEKTRVPLKEPPKLF